ncbi:MULTISPECIES: hypothetical protein [Mesorhizobium]|uniref:Secreted protein n=1 Tax=Mesorhizobium shonense TaxID=1209948 RepID=A0ABV2I4E2_9HYPH|nr:MULTISPECIES: hypothetical protein [unclassified Mesorhizobium]AZO28511.1 hypothetical protein EJ071_14645 [Mesorhizobium sp. M1B.F.Ca.ET.045.04.1.1]RWA69373.1 MAG: hypothetical protein EOQ29_17535 [Mesorhizobium sp.]RWA77130.1 MAG: hypothetical protein EOQ30_32975 [Mesorhizobium sp.]RWB20899.1 MAG: hypothetical protein EOQ40_13410 [Mesorhizobium sp.]RWE03202.1 MAG: hypothetical protein EOS40_05030 [Mesorhizobium sp.]
MDAATAAVMVLLLCSGGDPAICKPVNTATRVFASLGECRTSLAIELAGDPSGRMIGRCKVVDPTVTGSLPAGYTTVTVTHGGRAVRYIVPHKK